MVELSRAQIVQHRLAAGMLDGPRRPIGAASLRKAAWVGLQDSSPRAALLSIHARVTGAGPESWRHPSLVQLWGPRHSDYVVAAKDLAVFSLGRMREDERGKVRAQQTADRLEKALGGRRMRFGDAAREMGVPANSLRYAAATGRVLLHWDGAHQPEVWVVPAPQVGVKEARVELARRFLHVFGPSTSAAFQKWAGVRPGEAAAAFAGLTKELTAVRTPIGDGWVLAADLDGFRGKVEMGGGAVRLLPSGDAFFLAWGAERELLVADSKRRAELWTSRVWPGALLVDGEIAGVWRRAAAEVSIEAWRGFSRAEREAVEVEARSLPIPGVEGQMKVVWGRD